MTELSMYYRIPYNLEKSTYNDIFLFAKMFLLNFVNINKLTKTIVVFSVFILQNLINPAQIYHFIRLQSLMRLYVIFGFCDVCDKMITTILKDIQCALIRYKLKGTSSCDYNIDTAEGKLKLEDKMIDKLGCEQLVDMLDKTETSKDIDNCYQKKYTDVLYYVLLHILYFILTLLHTLLLLIHYSTLHVCTNSNIYVLYTLLISVNFVEIRTTMFKKFCNESIKTLYNIDTLKRFYNILFLVVIYFYNVSEDYDGIDGALLLPIILIYAIKVVVDWIKHIFAVRLNNLNVVRYKVNAKIDFLSGNILFVYLMTYLCSAKMTFEQLITFILC